MPVVGIILGRDVFLVAGAFAARAQSLGWRWPGAAEFFRLGPVSAAGSSSSSSSSGDTAAAAAAHDSGGGGASDGRAPTAPAPLVQPLFISKVNTVVQLVLVGTCISDAWLGWPGQAGVWAAAGAASVTTLWSCAAYVAAYRAGRLLTAGTSPPH